MASSRGSRWTGQSSNQGFFPQQQRPQAYDHYGYGYRQSHHQSPHAVNSRTHSKTPRMHWPPPPSVEDESDSLSRETTPSLPELVGDEAQMRGSVDQQPIILEIDGPPPTSPVPLYRDRNAPGEVRRRGSDSSHDSPGPSTPPDEHGRGYQTNRKSPGRHATGSDREEIEVDITGTSDSRERAAAPLRLSREPSPYAYSAHGDKTSLTGDFLLSPEVTTPLRKFPPSIGERSTSARPAHKVLPERKRSESSSVPAPEDRRQRAERRTSTLNPYDRNDLYSSSYEKNAKAYSDTSRPPREHSRRTRDTRPSKGPRSDSDSSTSDAIADARPRRPRTTIDTLATGHVEAARRADNYRDTRSPIRVANESPSRPDLGNPRTRSRFPVEQGGYAYSGTNQAQQPRHSMASSPLASPVPSPRGSRGSSPIRNQQYAGSSRPLSRPSSPYGAHRIGGELQMPDESYFQRREPPQHGSSRSVSSPTSPSHQDLLYRPEFSSGRGTGSSSHHKPGSYRTSPLPSPNDESLDRHLKINLQTPSPDVRSPNVKAQAPPSPNRPLSSELSAPFLAPNSSSSFSGIQHSAPQRQNQGIEKQGSNPARSFEIPDQPSRRIQRTTSEYSNVRPVLTEEPQSPRPGLNAQRATFAIPPRSAQDMNAPPRLPPRQTMPTNTDMGHLNSEPGQGRAVERSPQPIASRQESTRRGQARQPALPICPRPQFSSAHNDWYTLLCAPGFDLCPTCKDGLENAGFVGRFAHTGDRNKGMRIRCDLSDPWIRIAWLLVLQGRADHNELIPQITNIFEHEPKCPGQTPQPREWARLFDDRSGTYISNFDVCASCVRLVELIFPNLAGAFHLTPAHSGTHRTCDLTVESPRFARYVDTLETVSTDADRLRHEPDMSRFVAFARAVAGVRRCTRDDQFRGREWHYIPQLPDFTICEECFVEVVSPIAMSGSEVASMVHLRPQLPPLRSAKLSCQLYSPRMRSVFEESAKMNDYARLKHAALVRVQKERELQSRLERSLDLPEDRRAIEVARLVEEWKRWE